MISQFFVLSPRGDTIIHKDFRGDGFPNMQEEFFRKVRSSEGSPYCCVHHLVVCAGKVLGAERRTAGHPIRRIHLHLHPPQQLVDGVYDEVRRGGQIMFCGRGLL